MPSQNTAVQRLKVGVLPLDLPCCELVNTFKGNSNQRQVSQHTQNNNKLHTRRQTEAGKTTEEMSGCVREEQVNNCSNSMI